MVSDHLPRPWNNEDRPVWYQKLDQEAPHQLLELTLPLQVHIPIENDVFEILKNPKILHELKIWGIRCTGNIKNWNSKSISRNLL